MKKVISVTIVILFVLSLAACSSLKKEEIVGEYELISFSMKDGSINYTEEQLSQLKETGKVATLVIRDDDTATMDISLKTVFSPCTTTLLPWSSERSHNHPLLSLRSITAGLIGAFFIDPF